MKVRDMRTTEACRDLRHIWVQSRGGFLNGKNDRQGYFRVLVCQRCEKAERHQVLDRSGDVVKEQRKYDKTYLVKGGRLTPDELRMIRIINVMGR